MTERRKYPNPFRELPSTDEVRRCLKPIARLLTEGATPGVRKLIPQSDPLPLEFSCHLPSLSPKERYALAEKLEHEESEGRPPARHCGDFLLRFPLPAKPADRLPEFHYPAENGAGVLTNHKRFRFLLAVGDHCPEAKSDLFKRLRQTVRAEPDWRPGDLPAAFVERSLPEWAQHYHLDEPWVLEALPFVARHWSSHYNEWFDLDRLPQELSWQPLTGARRDPFTTDQDYQNYPERCRLTLNARWYPAAESRRAAEDRLLAELAAQVKHHLDHLEALHRDRGYVRSRDDWNPSAEAYVQESCELLALFQCVGRTLDQLTDTYRATKPGESIDRRSHRKKTVKAKITQLASEISLPLRP